MVSECGGDPARNGSTTATFGSNAPSKDVFLVFVRINISKELACKRALNSGSFSTCFGCDVPNLEPTFLTQRVPCACAINCLPDSVLSSKRPSSTVSWELSTQPGTAGAPTCKFQVCLLQGDKTP